MKLYKDIHKEKYQFMYLDLTTNPARVLRNFSEVVWEGGNEEQEII